MKIYNVRINTMDGGKIIENGYIEIENGKISAVCEGIPVKTDTSDIDGQGWLLVPGFIDPHSHIGIIENGIDFEGDDCNESTDPFTPQMRTIDGINPFDRCFEEAYTRGITSAVVCPGSANPCGGEIYAVKTYGRRVDDMAIKKVGIKFALGENPKNVYNDRDETPITRMASAALIREGLFRAKKYMDMKSRHENDPENCDEPEFDIKSEALIPLFRGEADAHFHCHRADDIFTALRIGKEFGINVVLVHATEGHLVADILGEEKAKAISGPIICDRCKPEMKALEISNTHELHKNGVLVSICTDHPVIPIQYLPMSAAMAIKGGLDEQTALEAITINAARTAGIDNITGSITPGKDADIQLYSGSPLDIMNEPELVMINGKIIKGDSKNA